MKKIIVAIDGYSSCGKSTLAKIIAKKYGYSYIDTGAMYRAVTLYFLRNKIMQNGIIKSSLVEKCLDEIEIDFKFNPEKEISDTFLNGENVESEIRGMLVSSNVSKVSQLKSVRRKMVKIQQKIGQNRGLVMDGRDIGTVVFPDAELKLFLTADAQVRAQRRYDELQAKGVEVSMEAIVKNLSERDFEDINRAESPLQQAKDAVVIDNTKMSVAEMENNVMALVEKAITAAQ